MKKQVIYQTVGYSYSRKVLDLEDLPNFKGFKLVDKIIIRDYVEIIFQDNRAVIIRPINCKVWEILRQLGI